MTQTQRIYLDYNSTAPLLPGAKAAMRDIIENGYGNPSSQHCQGRRAKSLIEGARRTVADFVDAPAPYLLFTGSATEANNQALRCVEWDNVLITAIEHDSVYKATLAPTLIPVNHDGIIDLNALEGTLKKVQGQKNLISVLWAHNETGVIQPLEAIIAMAKRYDACVHVDAVQALGKLPISFMDLGCDMMSLSAHKMGGPLGVGVLVVKETVPLSAFIRGGGQEQNRRAGTQNVLAIVGFEAALKEAPCLSHLGTLHRALEEKIKKLSAGASFIYSQKVDRLPNTTCVTLPGISHQTQVMHFDLEGFEVSAGAACSSGRVQVSRSLMAMVQNAELAQSALRLSTGWHTSPDDFEAFYKAWAAFYLKQHNSQTMKGVLP